MNTFPDMPVFPLSAIALPAGILPLRIFEPRYLDMVRDCLQQQRGFVISLVPPNPFYLEEKALPYRVGALVKIVDWDQLPDGLLGIVVRGESKVQLEQFRWQRNGLLMACASVLEAEEAQALPEEYQTLAELLQKVLVQIAPDWYPEAQFDEAVWVGYRLLELLPLDIEFRQQLLEMTDPILRLAVLMQAVGDWTAQ
jgi:Lon protease-like protein